MEELLKEHLYILILCGGSGKRLWPRSRNKAPKQFINLFDDKTLFQETVERSKRFVSAGKIFVITNADYVDEVRDQAKEIPSENIIAEPLGKNTAMAMALGSAIIHHFDPLAIVVNFASDHHITDLEEFDKAINHAVRAASSGDYLVTIGVKPTFAHTGMGYIKAGKKLEEINGDPVYKVDSFIEKPEEKVAEKFLKEGNFFWNANLYTWKANVILGAVHDYLPEIYKLTEKVIENYGNKEVLKQVYEEVEEISIDKGVSEKADNLILIPSDFKWSDVGDWKVVYDISKKDENGNVIFCEKGKGEFVGIDAKNCFVHFSDQLITIIGVDDLVVVDTKDALLIVKKDRTQDVKTLVNELKEKKKDKYL